MQRNGRIRVLINSRHDPRSVLSDIEAVRELNNPSGLFTCMESLSQCLADNDFVDGIENDCPWLAIVDINLDEAVTR